MTIPDGPWVNVGSGPAEAAGWTHLDASWQARLSGNPWLAPLGRALFGKTIGTWPPAVQYRDVRRGLGYEFDSVAVVYASHVIEHLHRSDARDFLSDAHRVLKPGAICRVVVPDVHAIVGWYLEHRQNTGNGSSSDLLMDMLGVEPREAPRGLARLLGTADLHTHKWMYDEHGLEALFREAGFSNATPRAFLDSAIPRARLELVEQASRISNGAGVCVEARKQAR
jgi:SAM-dependent methyltransferase